VQAVLLEQAEHLLEVLEPILYLVYLLLPLAVAAEPEMVLLQQAEVPVAVAIILPHIKQVLPVQVGKVLQVVMALH
jgi:hypothetical protein